jgi:hypothetical protein
VELEKLLGARHIFQTTPSEYCRTSLKENGAATLLCGSKFSFLKNNATALDVLSRYEGARVFPMGDLYFRIIFKEHTAFPKFVEFLRGANIYLKTNLIYIRFGGEEIRLTRGPTGRQGGARYPQGLPSRPQGNFLIVSGLPVYANEKAIIKWVTDRGYSIIRHFWGADSDLLHRFIIEIKEVISVIPDYPKIVANAAIEVTFSHSTGGWSEISGNSDFEAISARGIFHEKEPEFDGVMKMFLDSLRSSSSSALLANPPPQQHQQPTPQQNQTTPQNTVAWRMRPYIGK